MKRKGHAAHHTTAREAQNRGLTVVMIITDNRPTYCKSLCTDDSHTIQGNFQHRKTAF
jgi:hypothetical protein